MVITGQEGDWYKVSIAARPNHQEGWVKASEVTVTEHYFHGELVLSERMFRVWNDNELIVETPVVIGTESTPTPVGRFFIAELLEAEVAGVSPGGAYGPWILATNGYSEQLELFDSGLPVVAFHGTNNPSLLGTQASNGCIRLPNDAVTKIAETIVPGTPVEIRP
jgi:lipoprotein-anchoring transpeptidase ErfK/SrfK